jgi:hypothetical protein
MFRRVVPETGDALVSVFFPGGCRLCEQLLTRASRLPICEEGLGAFPAEACAVWLASFGRHYIDRARAWLGGLTAMIDDASIAPRDLPIPMCAELCDLPRHARPGDGTAEVRANRSAGG